MLRRGAWSLVGAGLLAGGLLAGAAVEQGLLHRAAANTLSEAEATRLAGDLDQSAHPLIAGGEALAKVARLLGDAVVHIETRRTTASGSVEETGSGVIMSLANLPGTYVITNRHVVAGGRGLEDVQIQLADGRFLHPRQVWQDKATDVAVMRLPDGHFNTARWGDSDALQRGHMVLALGSPFGLSQSVSLGIVSGKGRRSLELGTGSDMLNQDFIQTDAAINPGNSGGPLVDLYGRLIGINTAIASNSGGNEGIAFSIPSNLVRRVAESLVRLGRVPRSWLGVKLDPAFDAAAAARFRLDRLRGAHVLQVYAETPAAAASMQKDDIVLALEGVEVQDENHLINLVSLTPTGRTVRLTVLRAGRTMTMEVLLGDRTELEHRSEPAPTPPSYSPTYSQPGGNRYRPTAFTSGKSLAQTADLPSRRAKPSSEPALRLHELTRNLAGQIGVAPGTVGLLVLETPAGSQLRPYDLITEVARRPMTSVDEFDQTLRSHAGQPLLVHLLRCLEGDPQDLLILLENP